MDKKMELLSDQAIDGKFSSLDLIGLLLKNRRIKNESEFLSPPYPELSLKLDKAVSLVKDAVARHKNILIYGDYDVDGITATAIFWQVLYKHTRKVIPFIPHRLRDGYGIKAASFFRFQEEKGVKFDLLITVDNGIVAKKELEKIKKSQNIEIIVTDHHLPDKENLLNSKLGTVVHSSLISGAAVSWFLASALDKSADLGLAALGTVADCLPLTGVNRSIVVHGLKELRLNPSFGIKKLVAVSGIRQDSLSVGDLGFILGPRLNAVGRLSEPTDALRLLCSRNSLQAAKYAHVLNTFNQDRQALQKDSLMMAEAEVLAKLKNNKLIFSASPQYNPGIIGLLAGRLTEKYYLPSVILAYDDGVAKGSCRSIPELNIIEFLRQFSPMFIDLGGHQAAAGFSIKTENIPKLRKTLIKAANTKLKKVKLEPTLVVDAAMTLQAASLKNIKAISTLAPFGIGNPEPLFLFKDVVIQNLKIMGSTGDHLKLKVASADTPKSAPLGTGVDAVAFRKADLAKSLKVGQAISLAATLSSNTWNNLTVPQLIVKEIFI